VVYNETEFASAERASSKSVLRTAKLLGSSGFVHHVTNTLPSILLILNQQRQVVFKNQRLMELLGTSSDLEVLGKRPGELLDCIHASESSCGCGTTEFCRECGAVNAILETQNQGKTTKKECRIITNKGDVFDFRVWTSPYTFEDTEFTILSLTDISDEKRRQVLERTFFHDLNNILAVIIGRSDLLDDPDIPDNILESVESIRSASEQLLEEVDSHKKLLVAENEDLTVNLSQFDSVSILDEVLQLFSKNSTWQDRSIVTQESSEGFEITTDRTLLRRILCNMVKNALEATSEGEEVRLACTTSNSTGVFSVHNPNYMPRAVQLQVFQRSFSTKGKGRGIGAYSMKLFGEKYLKGKVWFSTSEETGTTFYVSVPLLPSLQQD